MLIIHFSQTGKPTKETKMIDVILTLSALNTVFWGVRFMRFAYGN